MTDTNLIEILKVLAEQRQGNPMLVGLGMVILALAPTLAALAGWLKSIQNGKETKEIKDSVSLIHIAVNSERDKSQQSIKELRLEISQLIQSKALSDQKRESLADTASQVSAARLEVSKS